MGTSDVIPVGFSPDGTKLALYSSNAMFDNNSAGAIYDVLYDDDGISYLDNGTPRHLQDNSGSLKLWDVASGSLLGSVGDVYDIISLTFSPDGSKIASQSEWDVQLWDVATGEALLTLDGTHACFSPDWTKVALGSHGTTIKLWDIATGQLLRTYEAPSSVWSLSFSPDGTKIAVGYGSGRGGVELWDVTSNTRVQTLEGHSTMVKSVSFSPDGTKVASGDYRDVKIWDVTSGECLQTHLRHLDEVKSVSFSPDGTKLVAQYYGDVNLWDVATGELQYRLSPPWGYTQGDMVLGHSFSQNGVFLKIASWRESNRRIYITTYLLTPWIRDAKNTLLAFAIRRFQADPLPFVRRMYPQFYDGARYLFYNEEEGTIERKSQQEIIDWYNDRLAEEQARQTPNAVRRNIETLALKF
jgi:WD40 repeat protein